MMKLVLNFEKKHFYSILSLLVVLGSITFAFASLHNPGHSGDQILVTFEDEGMSLNDAMIQLSGSLGDIEYSSASCTATNTELGGCDTNSECKCSVSCPDGKFAITGGVYFNEHTRYLCGLAYSGPSSGGAGWTVGLLPKSACSAPSGEVTGQVYAICAD